MVRTLGLINNRLTELADNNAALVNAIRGSGDLNAREPAPYDTSFTPITVDLISANVDKKITVPRPCAYIQAWCDGVLDGIGIKIGTQDRPITYFNQFNIIPVPNPETIYLSNDVRLGRSKLILVFSRSVPLSPQMWGEGIDLKELAVRLGAVSTYDRRGEIIWYDDFESGLAKWTAGLSGIGASAALSVASSLRGNFSLKLVAGSDANRFSQVTHIIAAPKYTNPWGVEVAWALDSNVEEAQFLLDAYTGSVVIHWGVRSVIATGQTAILTAAGVWTNVDTGTLYPPYANVKHYIHFKFVIDPITMEYKRFLLASLDIPVKGYSGYAAVDLTNGHIELIGKNIGTIATNAVVHADNFIVTQNEPV